MDDLARFQDQLDRYGADLTRWPERERERGVALLDTSQPARQLLARAEALDGDLRGCAPDARVPAMRRAILDALPPHSLAASGRGSMRWWRLGWTGGCGAAPASLVLSFYLGTKSAEIWPEDDAMADEAGYAELDAMLLGIGFDGDGGGRT